MHCSTFFSRSFPLSNLLPLSRTRGKILFPVPFGLLVPELFFWKDVLISILDFHCIGPGRIMLLKDATHGSAPAAPGLIVGEMRASV